MQSPYGQARGNEKRIDYPDTYGFPPPLCPCLAILNKFVARFYPRVGGPK